jgi:hypothetical protein
MEDTKVKHTNITTIYKDNENGKYLQKSLKIPSWEGLDAETQWSN